MGSRKGASAVPAARSEGILVEPVGDEVVVYNTETREAHCLKPLAAFVFESADGTVTADTLAQRASDHLGEPTTAEQINDAVLQLRECQLLDEPLVMLDGTSRREALKRFAYAGAAATAAAPLVTSIISPTAAMAASPIPPGCSGCTQNHQCAPSQGGGTGCTGNEGHCCTNDNQTCAALLGCCVDCNNSCALRNGLCTVCLGSGQCPTTCPGGAPPCPCTTVGC